METNITLTDWRGTPYTVGTPVVYMCEQHTFAHIKEGNILAIEVMHGDSWVLGVDGTHYLMPSLDYIICVGNPAQIVPRNKFTVVAPREGEYVG